MFLRRSAAGSIVIVCHLVLCSAAAAAPHTVQTAASFDSYLGPVGAPINSGPPPTSDPAYGPSRFTNGMTTFDVSPQTPYPGYSGPEFATSGTALQTFPGGWSNITFSNQFTGGGGEAPNVLALGGTTTSGVEVGIPFHIATLSFTNGDWFSSSPQFDPGNGPLYPVSRFALTVTATADPLTGTEPHVWTDTLLLVSTRGAGTPDNLFLENHPLLGGIAIAEGTTGTAEVWGRLGSLQPVEFRNFTGGASAIPPVPEPSTILLIGFGLPLIARRSRGGSRRMSRVGRGCL